MRAKPFFWFMIGLAVSTVIVAGVAYYFFSQRLDGTINSIADREVDIKVAQQELINLGALEHELARIEDIKPKIDAALPSDKTQSQIVAQVLEIARANGVNFRNIAFVPTDGLPGQGSQTETSTVLPSVSTVPITLSSESVSYEALKNFLRSVLELRRNANVASLTLNRDDTRSGNVTVNIRLDLHLEKVPEQLSDAEKAKRRAELEASLNENQ